MESISMPKDMKDLSFALKEKSIKKIKENYLMRTVGKIKAINVKNYLKVKTVIVDFYHLKRF